jgi:hypothetical protein
MMSLKCDPAPQLNWGDKGHAWIVSKTYLTNIIVMTKMLFFVWIVANYLTCQCLFGQSRSPLLSMLANTCQPKGQPKF